MVYTQERLRQALDVFRKSEPYRKLRNLEAKHLGSLLEDRFRQYETRSGEKRSRAATNFPGTWKDAEDSDDYSPRKKKGGLKDSKTGSGQSSAKRKRSEGNSSEENKRQKRGKNTYTRGRQKGWTLDITLKFHTEEARAKVAALFPAPKTILQPSVSIPLTPPPTPNSGSTAPVKQFPPPFIPPKIMEFSQPKTELSPPKMMNFSQPTTMNVTPPKTMSYTPPKTINSGLPKMMGSVNSCHPISNANHHKPKIMNRQSNSLQNPILVDDSDEPMTDSPTFGNPQIDNIGKTPYTKVILTSWNHPIQYMCAPHECLFCKDARIRFLGVKRLRRSEVLVHGPGNYEEIDGGPQGPKVERTKICFNCCMDRMEMAKCQHEIVPFDGHLSLDVGYDDFLGAAMQDPEGKLQMCSVCVGPALYACGYKKQVSLSLSGGGVRHGCGLLLCKQCAEIVTSRGRLDYKVLERPGSKKRRHKLRADCDFILPRSDMMLACGK